MIPSSPLLTVNTANSISASVSSSPLLRKSESFKNENKIDSQSRQQIKEQNKNDNDNNNNNIINKNNINNNQSRSLSASYELRKSTTLRNDDVSAVRKYSGHTYVRTSVDTGGGGETPYSSSTYTATTSNTCSKCSRRPRCRAGASTPPPISPPIRTTARAKCCRSTRCPTARPR